MRWPFRFLAMSGSFLYYTQTRYRPSPYYFFYTMVLFAPPAIVNAVVVVTGRGYGHFIKSGYTRMAAVDIKPPPL